MNVTAQILAGAGGIYLGSALVWAVNWASVRTAIPRTEWERYCRKQMHLAPVWPIAFWRQMRNEDAQ